MQELLYLIMTNGDTKSALEKTLSERVPFLEVTFPGESAHKFDDILNSPPPRLMKTHLPSSWYIKDIQKEKPKFIVVYRNPKDCLVSYYHQYQDLFEYDGSFNHFFEMYKRKELFYGDPFDHIISWWKYKDEDNVLITSYEEMIIDIRGIIKKVARFLNKELSDETIDSIIVHTSFEFMKTNAMLNLTHKLTSDDIMRRGIIGDWKNHLTPHQNSLIESRANEVTKEYGIAFHYEHDE